MYTQAELDALDDKEYRDAYVDSHVKAFIAHQMRCIREARGLSQADFATLVGKPQSVISRLENTEYGRVTVQTLLDLAHALDVSLVVKMASFPEFLKIYGDLSPKTLAVSDFSGSGTEMSVLRTITASAVLSTSVDVATAGSCIYGSSQYYPAYVSISSAAAIVQGVVATPFVSVQPFPTSTRGQNV